MKNTTIYTADEGKRQRNGTGDVLAQAATTKYCKAGWLQQHKIIFHCAGGWDIQLGQSCWQIQFLVKALFLTCR